MVDLTEQEEAALTAALTPVGEVMDEIGWETRLCDIEGLEVLRLVRAAVQGFRDGMEVMDDEIPF